MQCHAVPAALCHACPSHVAPRLADPRLSQRRPVLVRSCLPLQASPVLARPRLVQPSLDCQGHPRPTKSRLAEVLPRRPCLDHASTYRANSLLTSTCLSRPRPAPPGLPRQFRDESRPSRSLRRPCLAPPVRAEWRLPWLTIARHILPRLSVTTHDLPCLAYPHLASTASPSHFGPVLAMPNRAASLLSASGRVSSRPTEPRLSRHAVLRHRLPDHCGPSRDEPCLASP